MPARPVRRALVAGALLTSLGAAALGGAAPVSAEPRDSLPRAPESLRAAVADGSSELSALPRGYVRRAPAGTRAGLRTGSSAPADGTGPVARGSLTTSPVSVINVTYRAEGGATWSEAAKAAFEAAVRVWERTIESAVPIEVSASACGVSSTSVDCGGFAGDPTLLGGAGPFDFRRNTQGTQSLVDDVFEPVALANARRGADTLPDDPDVVAAFNPGAKSRDGSAAFYFGLDGNPPDQQIDFKTVVLHEIGHGLGLVGTASVDGDGRATVGDREVNAGPDDPTPCTTCVRSGTSYDTFTYATSAAQAGNGGSRVLSLADGSEELKTALTGNSLYWAGQLARTAAGGGKVRLYAPFDFFAGTSYGHLDEASYAGEHPNGLMTPFIEPGESISDVGQIAMGMLADMGYAVPALRGARYTPVAPVRLLDTRTRLGTSADAPTTVGPAGVVDLRVTGTAGVPTDATAVVLNVTGVTPSTATDLRVYPTPVVLSPVPNVSNLNLAGGVTRANLVTVPVGNNGRVRLRNNAGSVAMVADLAGYYAPAAAATFTPAEPVRILDTRSATGTTATTPVGAGEFLDLAVSGGSSPVPADAAAVALTVTAVGATDATDVRAYPTPADGSGPPTVSNLNVEPGPPVPNVVVVKVGQDGKVRLRNAKGSVHLLADVAGWYDGDLAGGLFRPVTPSRVLDTRIRLGIPSTASTTVGPGESIALRVGGIAQVPSLASSAVLNVTGVAATTSTDVRVYPATATSVPRVSNLNLGRGQTAADLVMVKLGNRSVRLRNAEGRVALLADVAGWFGPPS